MDFHAFMYVTIGRRHELERGMAGKDPVLYQRMLDEIAEYARACDATGWSGIGIPEHHLQIEGFELGQDPGLMAMFLGHHAPKATGPWNRKTDDDARNRELFEECVAIIKTAWTHDTFSFKGKYWSFPPDGQRQPHVHPVYLKYGRGVDAGGAVREVGIAPRPLRNPIPVYSGFTYSLQTSLYSAREGGKPIVMAGEMDFYELLWRRYREVAEEHGRRVPRGEEAAWGGYLVLADSTSEAEAWAEDCLWMWDSWSTLFGQGILERDRCLKALELFADKVIPRFR